MAYPRIGLSSGSNTDAYRRFLKNLKGEDRNAFAALVNLFKSYGLESLTDDIYNFVTEGYSADTISILLQETPAYKKRFWGNQKRQEAGLPVLSPKEYLAVESSYRQVMDQAGLPPKFYDSYEDFGQWIANDVSPTEIQSRVKAAQGLVEAVDPEVRRQFEKYYSTGEIVAYALDRKRTTELLERQAAAARIGAAGVGGGFQIGQQTAEQIAELGVEEGAARQGVAQAAQYSEGLGRLGAIYGEQYSEDDAIEDVFLNDVHAQRTRKRLASQERAQFGGSSGANDQTLRRSRGGAF